MPAALSLDLRSRLVSACQTGELTQREIADMFQVHLKTVEKLWRHFRQSGSVQAKPHSGGVKAQLAGQEDTLRRLIAEQSDHTLAVYVDSKPCKPNAKSKRKNRSSKLPPP